MSRRAARACPWGPSHPDHYFKEYPHGPEDHCLDLHRLLALRHKVAAWLQGEVLHGTLWRAGLPKTFAPTA